MKIIEGALPLLRSELLSALPGIGHAVTTRLGGVSVGPCDSLNLGRRDADPDVNLLENRRRACAAAGARFETLTVAKQMLGNGVVRVRAEHAGIGAHRPGALLEEGDALITDLPGVPLMTLSADCGLLLLADPVRRAVASIHSARDGARDNVTGATVAALVREFGSRPRDLVALVGPSIGPCCHHLHGRAVQDWRRLAPARLQDRDGRPWLDLKGVLRDQLAAAGVTQVDCWDLCTRCRSDWFFSHRRDGVGAGRFAALIWLA